VFRRLEHRPPEDHLSRLDRGELERLVAGEVADHAGLAQPKFVSEATERQAAEPLHRGVLYRALEDPPARPLCLGV
jgi:hypothetical protein